MIDLSAVPIIDHHAHPLSRGSATAEAATFRRWFTESTNPDIHRDHVPHTLFLRSAVRWLAEELDCAPTLETVLEARAALNYKEWTRRLFKQANIETLLCDYGYSGPGVYSHQEMVDLLPCEVRPILRLESLAEELIHQTRSFSEMVEAFVEKLRLARSEGIIALKSIIAYRTGLAISLPDHDAARRGFLAIKESTTANQPVRLADKAILDYLFWLSLEEAERQELPLQIHTGFGDQDADLLKANPLHLRPVIGNTRAPLVLLHAGWPYYRETAHLASLYPHVWLDISLAIPFATTGIPTMLRDILGMAPSSKILFATDAFTMPEIFWLAARWGRWGLGQVLGEMVEARFLDAGEATAVAWQILNGNARYLYHLE